LLLLQAGEVMEPGSLSGALAELARLGMPAVATSDHDRLDAEGRRRDPTIGPTPSHALMLSGVPAQGAWFVRRDLVPTDLSVSGGGRWAAPVRLAAWLAAYRDAPGTHTVRLPFVLSHQLPAAESAPPTLLAKVVNTHLTTSGQRLRVAPGRSGALHLVAPPQSEKISILVPSTLRTPRTRRCLDSLLEFGGPLIEMVVAVAQPRPLDAAQARMAATLCLDPRVRVAYLPMPSFNFALANNRAAALARHDLLLLMNDDVAPTDPNWLAHMAAHLDDPRIGVVGPQLTYPDGTVQHAGVLMGLGGRCDHAGRFRLVASVAPTCRVMLDQEMSAVTGACMLVRRSLFDALGGLDEAYPSAFNDIDFCLRAREEGWGVVYAGSVSLVHDELRTYGSHYAGNRAAYRLAEMTRFSRRWADVIAADPFHNPNLSLIPGAEDDLAFPPRLEEWHRHERPARLGPAQRLEKQGQRGVAPLDPPPRAEPLEPIRWS
jgi:O-antigen biosynthesis protein